MNLIEQLAHELNLKTANVEAAVKLIDEGNTIPFIARYRKEATGSMDDVALRALDDRLSYLRNLEQRKGGRDPLIDAQGKLTPELEQQIREATAPARRGPLQALPQKAHDPRPEGPRSRLGTARQYDHHAGLGQGQRARCRRGIRQRGYWLRDARGGTCRRVRHCGRNRCGRPRMRS